MPNMNKTGPLGQGAETGLGRGRCGNGLRRGRGCWSGYGLSRNRYISPKNELAALEEEEKMLLEELEVIKAEKQALKSEK